MKASYDFPILVFFPTRQTNAYPSPFMTDVSFEIKGSGLTKYLRSDTFDFNTLIFHENFITNNILTFNEDTICRNLHAFFNKNNISN